MTTEMVEAKPMTEGYLRKSSADQLLVEYETKLQEFLNSPSDGTRYMALEARRDLMGPIPYLIAILKRLKRDGQVVTNDLRQELSRTMRFYNESTFKEAMMTLSKRLLIKK